jgi:hypothetical protein
MRASVQRLIRKLVPTPQRAVRLFVVANVAFLGLDIVIAHLANDFARTIEWAPVIFSAIATQLLLPGALGSTRSAFRYVDLAVAAGAIFVGVAGMVFHLESGFFEARTLHNLVYSAPFVAPLSYVGVGLLLVLVHTRDGATADFGRWVLALALGGFVGNFALSLLDHAQNGFFRASEWVPVAAAAYAITFLALAVSRRSMSETLFRACLVVMTLEVLVGLVGAWFHVEANLRSPMTSLRDRFVFGAPAFAPLLFANLALLAFVGLWACKSSPDGGDESV